MEQTDTHIRVSNEMWEELNRRKQQGDSFDDVLKRELPGYNDE